MKGKNATTLPGRINITAKLNHVTSAAIAIGEGIANSLLHTCYAGIYSHLGWNLAAIKEHLRPSTNRRYNSFHQELVGGQRWDWFVLNFDFVGTRKIESLALAHKVEEREDVGVVVSGVAAKLCDVTDAAKERSSRDCDHCNSPQIKRSFPAFVYVGS
jgi:hypothetical protein